MPANDHVLETLAPNVQCAMQLLFSTLLYFIFFCCRLKTSFMLRANDSKLIFHTMFNLLKEKENKLML